VFQSIVPEETDGGNEPPSNAAGMEEDDRQVKGGWINRASVHVVCLLYLTNKSCNCIKKSLTAGLRVLR